MASDCYKEIERIAREGCMMIDDWVFGNTLAEDKYPPLKECLVRVVTDALRIPDDCVRLADGRVVAPGAGVLAVLAERERQVSVEGWTADDDDEHKKDEMAIAAACCSFPAELRNSEMLAAVPDFWPWAKHWWKPTPDDRIRELTKAGALIAAEIDRLTRAAEAARGEGGKT